MSPTGVALLGSTGSIGEQAIDVIREADGRFRVVALAARRSAARLAAQARDLRPEVVALVDDTEAGQLARDLPAGCRLEVGPEAVGELAALDSAEVVLNGVTGSVGLRPTLRALEAGRRLALANKESLIVGGSLVASRARPGQIVPVDSEHSALAQCLRAGSPDEVARLVITASGGPFRGRSAQELAGVSPEEALAHPTWSMGPVISVNCATLVNKGLEVIEAHLLFGVAYDDVEVVVHPQSVVHSMVEFSDGSTLAQASPPDMRLPIALAMGWPDRVPGAAAPLDWTSVHRWDFLPLDEVAFPAVQLCREAGRAGGAVPAALNAANEEAVAAFLAGGLAFRGILDVVARVTSDAPRVGNPRSVAEVVQVEEWARRRARELVAGQAAGSGG